MPATRNLKNETDDQKPNHPRAPSLHSECDGYATDGTPTPRPTTKDLMATISRLQAENRRLRDQHDEDVKKTEKAQTHIDAVHGRNYKLEERLRTLRRQLPLQLISHNQNDQHRHCVSATQHEDLTAEHELAIQMYQQEQSDHKEALESFQELSQAHSKLVSMLKKARIEIMGWRRREIRRKNAHLSKFFDGMNRYLETGEE